MSPHLIKIIIFSWVSLARAGWYVPCNDYNSDVQSALAAAELSDHYDKVTIQNQNCLPESDFANDDDHSRPCDF